jgi:hypothetical protein
MKNNEAGRTPTNSDLEHLLNRRQWLQGASALILAGLMGSATLKALAASTSADAFGAFMTLSKALTERQNLNVEVGQRLFNALQHNNPNFPAQLSTLSGAIASGQLIPEQEAQALNILQAWYLGTVNNQVITYEQALMFDVASDILEIRSYCPNQPGFWASKPISKEV